MCNMANSKHTPPADDAKAPVAALIAKARKEGSIQASELSAELEKLDLSVEKIEQIYEMFENMGIHIISASLETDQDLLIILDEGLQMTAQICPAFFQRIRRRLQLQESAQRLFIHRPHLPYLLILYFDSFPIFNYFLAFYAI